MIRLHKEQIQTLALKDIKDLQETGVKRSARTIELAKEQDALADENSALKAELAAEHGFAALQAAVAIVLGIIVVAELPNSLFNFLFGRRGGRKRIR